ncbi:MAG: hypothetical protein OXH53_05225 [bacterium]|nr:hypothetical protein [bacterium]
MNEYEKGVLEAIDAFEKAAGDALSDFVRRMRYAQIDSGFGTWISDTSVSEDTRERLDAVLDAISKQIRDVRRWSRSELALRPTRSPEDGAQ